MKQYLVLFLLFASIAIIATVLTDWYAGTSNLFAKPQQFYTWLTYKKPSEPRQKQYIEDMVCAGEDMVCAGRMKKNTSGFVDPRGIKSYKGKYFISYSEKIRHIPLAGSVYTLPIKNDNNNTFQVYINKDTQTWELLDPLPKSSLEKKEYFDVNVKRTK